MDAVSGARGIGSVSSDAVFGAGMAMAMVPGGELIGGFLVGWAIA
ncbi:hypothetical protein GCM10007870_21030 [Gluconobacter kondonii]|uniref:Uncharacterized protein n=1 Tax=Gluconobacter kondonii TaxID=941463 RepID=A0ABQ5WU65_9PROT|nr:hypothetical protein AA3266_2495 [Gluconobacter kondonii NBRC 3266]GLQ66519.1 hypothetical protein GCM10007870_21030 [Gluconobacter kondonii]